MINIIILVLTLSWYSAIFAADTTTLNLGLTKPEEGSTSWGPKINADLDLIDTKFGTLGSAAYTSATNYEVPLTFSSPLSRTGNTISSQLFVTNAKTSTYQVLASDFLSCKTIPVASGTFTITLVASGSQPAAGQCIEVINYGSGVITIARSGQNINGVTTSITLPASSATAPTSARIVSDGTNYFASLTTIGTFNQAANYTPTGAWDFTGSTLAMNHSQLSLRDADDHSQYAIVASGTNDPFPSTVPRLGGVYFRTDTHSFWFGDTAFGNYVSTDTDGYGQMTDGANAVTASGNSTFKFVGGAGLTATVSGSPDKVTYALNAGNTRQRCIFENDTQSATVLTDAQITGHACQVPADATLVEIVVSASGGTPSVTLERFRPSNSATADLQSGALATGSSGAVACSFTSTSATCPITNKTSSSSITLSNTSLTKGDFIRIKTATAGGVATWHNVTAWYQLN